MKNAVAIELAESREDDRREAAWADLLRDKQAINDYYDGLKADEVLIEELRWIFNNCPEAVEDAMSASDDLASVFRTALLMSDEFAEKHKGAILDENQELWR